ncbi:MAG TPA: CAP domain-containing protein [Thermoanaerobaculia bacterium]
MSLLLSTFLLAAAPVPSRPVLDPEALRQELVLRINKERQTAGVHPVAPSAPLDKVAQTRADEIRTRGAMPDESEAFILFSKIQGRLARSGYLAHGWTESLTATTEDLDDVIATWKKDPSYQQAMSSDLQDVGVGVADLGGVPLYVFLFAWPKSEHFARETKALLDLEAARDALLARANAERTAAGRPPLVVDPRLNAAAQAHAEDMLAHTYYSHQGLTGSMPRQRVHAAGYIADIVAENIAAGQVSVENVMEAWLHSSDHRRNLLDPRFTHTGVGIAVGSFNHRYKVLWVQDFARPQPPLAGVR